MPCFHPIKGVICQDGKFRFNSYDVRSANFKHQTIPCGQCVGCRLERSRQWAIRCMHEASLYSRNCFITLTYNDENLPFNGSLCYRDFQEFMKRLRAAHEGSDLVSHPYAGEVNVKTGKVFPDFYRPIRFYMCGEYGPKFSRPHYHACIFNFDFSDRKFWRLTNQKNKIFTSEILKKLWPHGFHEIGDVSFQSSAYVARYIMKKVLGPQARYHYNEIDDETGEILNEVEPEFTRMSLKPGIAEGWFRKYRKDVFPHDYVVVNGKKCKTPRYYDNKFKEYFPDDFDVVKEQREISALERLEDNTPERLYVKELVAKEKLSRLKRSLA